MYFHEEVAKMSESLVGIDMDVDDVRKLYLEAFRQMTLAGFPRCTKRGLPRVTIVEGLPQAGYYQPWDHRIYLAVRDDGFLVHELVHALQGIDPMEAPFMDPMFECEDGIAMCMQSYFAQEREYQAYMIQFVYSGQLERVREYGWWINHLVPLMMDETGIVSVMAPEYANIIGKYMEKKEGQ